jgi:hypothetical protein
MECVSGLSATLNRWGAKWQTKRDRYAFSFQRKRSRAPESISAGARESLEKLSQLVVGKLGKDHPTVAGFKVGSQAIEKGHIPSDLDRGLPDVTVFVDENGDCVGMYVDPPGICTDEC